MHFCKEKPKKQTRKKTRIWIWDLPMLQLSHRTISFSVSVESSLQTTQIISDVVSLTGKKNLWVWKRAEIKPYFTIPIDERWDWYIQSEWWNNPQTVKLASELIIKTVGKYHCQQTVRTRLKHSSNPYKWPSDSQVHKGDKLFWEKKNVMSLWCNVILWCNVMETLQMIFLEFTKSNVMPHTD